MVACTGFNHGSMMFLTYEPYEFLPCGVTGEEFIRACEED
jgi:hypothetical protein